MRIRDGARLATAAATAATLCVVPGCSPADGLASGTPALVRCVPQLRRVPADEQGWASLGAPLDSVDYRMFWDAAFQVYEVVFRNRSATVMTLHYTARGSSDDEGAPLRRELRPHTADGPPGASVAGARTGASACVVVDHVDSGGGAARRGGWDKRPRAKARGPG